MPRAYSDTILSSKSGKTALILGDPLLIETRQAVSRNIDLQLAGLGRYGLAAIAVTRIASVFAARQMTVHLRVQRALRQSRSF